MPMFDTRKFTREIRHFHMFCGCGGGALGFNQGHARVGRLKSRMRCIGGVDVSPGAIRDFSQLAGVEGTVLDLFSREQYRAFHGKEPPKEWREADANDIRSAAHWERPHIVFLSAPCKGFSGLNAHNAKTKKYQALNRLTVRGIGLMLDAWADDPPEFLIFENVPLIATKGAWLLEQIEQMLAQYGYRVARSTHNCGELGGLGQNRHRFLLVARHQEKIGPFLYEPDSRGIRTVGDVIRDMPMPNDPAAGPMHTMSSLQFKTWVRLALIPAGKDWRALEHLTIEDGTVQGLSLVPQQMFRGSLGVKGFDDVSGTVTGAGRAYNGPFSVADPRYSIPADLPYSDHARSKYRVTGMNEPSGAVIAAQGTGNGAYSIADPRMTSTHSKATGRKNSFRQYGVVGMDDVSMTVTSRAEPGSGAYSIADPRLGLKFNNCFRVMRWDETSNAVTGGSGPSAGGLSIADPRPVAWRDGKKKTFTSQRHYGVVGMEGQSATVIAHANYDRGPWTLADPRLPGWTEQCQPLIISEDDTWHRPFTTLELAALQGFPVDGLLLDGQSHKAWRERIGNAVPPPSAQVIASTMAETLLLAWAGQTLTLHSRPIWVQPLAIALAMA